MFYVLLVSHVLTKVADIKHDVQRLHKKISVVSTSTKLYHEVVPKHC